MEFFVTAVCAGQNVDASTGARGCVDASGAMTDVSDLQFPNASADKTADADDDVGDADVDDADGGAGGNMFGPPRLTLLAARLMNGFRLRVIVAKLLAATPQRGGDGGKKRELMFRALPCVSYVGFIEIGNATLERIAALVRATVALRV
jgi:hypothetical protein